MNNSSKLKHRILSMLLVIVMVVGMLPLSPLTVFAESQQPTPYDGIPVTPTVITSSNYQQFGLTESNWSSYNGYYGIRDAKELYGFANLVNGGSNTINGVLLQDIVINSGMVTQEGNSAGTTYSWTPIGQDPYPFLGIFDGNGCDISGLYVDTEEMCVGLFSEIGLSSNVNYSIVKNLSMSNSYIHGESMVGSIVGMLRGINTQILNCRISSDVSVSSTDTLLGGIVGTFDNIRMPGTTLNNLVQNCAFLGKASCGYTFGLLQLDGVSGMNAIARVGTLVGAGNADVDTRRYIVLQDCYYINDCLTVSCYDKYYNTFSRAYNVACGGFYYEFSTSEGSTKLSSVSDSHTCISVTHKEVQPTCQYPGLSGYSFCLICGAVTSGTKAVTAANSNAHVYYGATCCVAGVCGVCNTTGRKNMENHESTEYIYRSSGTQHAKYHACCNTLVGSEDHTYNSVGMCLYCEYVCPHDQYDNEDRCVQCGYLLLTVPTKVTASTCESLGLDASYVGYYAISNKYELYWFAGLVNGTLESVSQDTDANAVLLRDITVNENIFNSNGNLVNNTDAMTEWIPIGINVKDPSQSTGYEFSGTFDGRNHTISGLYHSSDKRYVALIGINVGTVCNVTVANSYLKGNERVAGIVGGNTGSIYNCASVSCQLIGTATYHTDVAGIVALSDGGRIDNCYNTSAVSGPGYIGGICGTLQSGGTITDCHSAGMVTGNEKIGGIVGVIPNNNYNVDCKVTNCYFNSDVFTGSGVGSLGKGTATNVEGKTTERFKSGEVTWLLNGETATGVWKQTLEQDDYPHFDGDTVYGIPMDCGGRNVSGYSNDVPNAISHKYDEDGICRAVAGEYHYKPAVLNEGVYEIYNIGNLMWFAGLVNGTLTDGTEKNQSADAVLMADIDLKEYAWTTICETSLYYKSYGTDLGYSGTFDGNGHVIKNISVTSSTTMDASCGLFGTASGTIKNLGIEGFTFTDGGYDIRAGAIVGQLITANGKVSNCYVKAATINPGAHVTGGIAGCVYEGTIENCYVVESTITGSSNRYGHIVGDSRGDGGSSDRPGTVTNCYTDNATIRSNNVGNVTNCATKTTAVFASGEVTYLLNGSSSEGVWKQTLGTQDYPQFTGDIVYFSYVDCSDDGIDYTNDIYAVVSERPSHTYDDNGICTVCGAYEPAVDVGGEGALFAISNAGQLLWYAQQYNSGAIDGDAELTTDITFSAGVALIPIGTDTRAYGGTFNGNGKTVNFGEQTTTVGYFGIVGNLNGGTVRDLTVSGAITVNADVYYVSGVVGAAAGSSTIEGCTSYVDITLSENAAGSQKISGIAGQITTGTTISHCANYGDISANGAKECIGGITGYANENCLITDCANYGDVSSDTAAYVSGILGYINNDKFKGVQDCLNVGAISGSSYVGDIIGWARNYATDTIVNNYYNGTTGFGADAQSGKNATAAKVTDDQLKSGEIAWLLNNSTSEGVWKQTIGNDEYPTLNAEGDIVYRNITNGCCEENYVYEYSNTEAEPVTGHIYVDGVCACGVAMPTDGEQVVIGDYTYTYYTDHTTGAPEGWNAVVNDTTKTSYGAIESEVNGLPVTQLYKTFAGCNAMTEAPAIPESVKVLYNTFKNCTAIASAPEIPEEVENMTYAFWGCNSLTEAPELPESVKILKGAFYNCTALTSAPDLTGVEDLTQAFDGCTNLTGEVTLTSDNAAKAFRGTGVTSVKITKNVTAIAQGTFDGCNITDITYEGTGAEFAALTVGSYNGSFRTATVKVTLADTPSVVSDGKRTYICDLENIKDLYIGKGTLATYREVKNNLYYGMTSAKLGNSNIFTYGALLPAGEYTLYVRYVDGSFDCVNFTAE